MFIHVTVLMFLFLIVIIVSSVLACIPGPPTADEELNIVRDVEEIRIRCINSAGSDEELNNINLAADRWLSKQKVVR
jgi:hypothetical protein